MSKGLILFALLSLSILGVKAQGLTMVSGGIDCGQVKFREPVTIPVEFKNNSNDDTKITGVRVSCGCVAASYPRGVLPRGRVFKVNVTFDAKQMGHFEKQVGIYYEGGKEPMIITLRGEVVENVVDVSADYPFKVGDVRTDVNDIEFDDVNRGDVLTSKIHIMNTATKPIQPVIMHLPNYLSAQVEPSTIVPGQLGVATITLDSRKLRDFGLTQTSVYLGMNPGDKVSEEKEIGVSAVLLPGFSGQAASPQNDPKIKISTTELNFADGGSDNGATPNLIERVRSLGDKVLNGGKDKTRYISIENVGKSRLDIRRLQIFTSGLSVSLNKTRLKPGEKARLKVRADMEELAKARRHPRVLMITNDPTSPKIIIMVNVK